MKEPDDDPWVRASVSLRRSLWGEIEEVRVKNHLATRADALRQIIVAGIKKIMEDQVITGGDERNSA